MSYVPTFVSGVTVTVWNYNSITHQMTEISSPVDPIYCLSNIATDPGSVQAFVALFPQFQATITQDNPEGPGFYGSASINGTPYTAPFITWASGAMTTGPMNAGVLANIYNHGYPDAFAYAQVIAVITSQLGF